jgi:hypothetical protein
LFDKDTILHLRIPFSIYLFPVFWFGISQSLNIHAIDVLIVGIVLHLFIYPASNLYNSYMDKDTGSIGGLEHPPPIKHHCRCDWAAAMRTYGLEKCTVGGGVYSLLKII